MEDRKMKDSGIPWVQDIPINWRTMPNKYVMKKKKELCPIYEGQDILSLTMDGVIIRDLDAGGKMPATFDGYQILYPGNLLMCLFDYDVTPRCIGLIKNKGLTSPAYSQFSMNNNNYSKYYYYYYLMIDHTKELLHLAKNLRHSFTEEQLGMINVPVPPVSEQMKIADFLDKKCLEIDGLISDVQLQLATLENCKKSVITEAVTKGLIPDGKMKDSGIEWVGKIPEKWKTSAISYITTSRSGGTPDRLNMKYWDGGTIPWMASGEVNKVFVYETNEHITKEGSINSSAKVVPKNSVMVALNGQGKTKGMSAILKIDSACNQSLCAFQCNSDVLFFEYLFFCFQAMYKYLRSQAGDGNRDGLAASFVKKQRIPLPPLDEQISISKYCMDKYKTLALIMDEKKKQLETLEQYKKTLIYEYVTGKKGVPIGHE